MQEKKKNDENCLRSSMQNCLSSTPTWNTTKSICKLHEDIGECKSDICQLHPTICENHEQKNFSNNN